MKENSSLFTAYEPKSPTTPIKEHEFILVNKVLKIPEPSREDTQRLKDELIRVKNRLLSI